MQDDQHSSSDAQQAQHSSEKDKDMGQTASHVAKVDQTAAEATDASANKGELPAEQTQQTQQTEQAEATSAAEEKEPPTESAETEEATTTEEHQTKKHKLRTSADVYNRIKWDPNMNTEEYTICYDDRFLGLLEVPFEAYDHDCVPFHRVWMFKHLGKIVWDREQRLDLIFGSGGDDE